MLIIKAIMGILNMAIKIQIDGEVFLVKVVEKRFKICFTITGGGWFWCPTEAKLKDHIFVRCKFVCSVWYEILKWLGVITVLSSEVFMQLEAFLGLFRKGKTLKGLLFAWHSTIWAVWCARNSFIFSSKEH